MGLVYRNQLLSLEFLSKVVSLNLLDFNAVLINVVTWNPTLFSVHLNHHHFSHF